MKIDKHGLCPKCGNSWDDGNIYDVLKENHPDKSEETIEEWCTNYSEGKEGRFSRLIGVTDRYVYDGTLYLMCPDCELKLQRFEEGTKQFTAAKERGAITIEEALESIKYLSDSLSYETDEHYNHENQYYELILPLWIIAALTYDHAEGLDGSKLKAFNALREVLPSGGKWWFADQKYKSDSDIFPDIKDVYVVDARYIVYLKEV